MEVVFAFGESSQERVERGAAHGEEWVRGSAESRSTYRRAAEELWRVHFGERDALNADLITEATFSSVSDWVCANTSRPCRIHPRYHVRVTLECEPRGGTGDPSSASAVMLFPVPTSPLARPARGGPGTKEPQRPC